ncbi:GspE/PulE family protein [Verrucomicrobiota bacterium]
MTKKPYSEKISGILIKRKAIELPALQDAEQEAHSSGERLEKYLVDKQLVSHADMALAISEYLGMPPIALSHFTPDPQLSALIPREVLVRHKAIPVSKLGRSLTVAVADPFDIIALDELQTLTGLEITPLVASRREIVETMERIFPNESGNIDIEDVLKEADADLEVTHEKVDEDQGESIDSILERAEGAPVVRMVSMILLEALRQGASDIHLEPQEKTLRLRYRIDGTLINNPSPPKHLQGAVISRMKIMSGMDIAENRIPQDGRIKIHALGKEVDLRVNTLPTIFGEKIVMRLLDKSALFPNLAALGLDEEAFRAMRHAIAQPNGVILVTGPTGSGKTTTLYSCLMELNQPEVNIITCEDPVEYQLPGINQVQINAFIGFTFSSALRSVLRQSPDIILVGEIRDSETAEIAIKAALTGHLVLSTLHTNDSAGAITRLTDMGVEPSLLASSLILAQAQRLIRKLCPACKKKSGKLPLDLLKSYDIAPSFFEGEKIYEAKGCIKCRNTGYKGRMAVMEVLPVDKELRKDILQGLSAKELLIKAQEKGMISLKDIGMQQVKKGQTSIEAALRVTGGE